MLPGEETIGVNNENAATNTETQKTDAVGIDDVALFIREQGKTEALGAGKFLVRPGGLSRDAPDIGA